MLRIVMAMGGSITGMVGLLGLLGLLGLVGLLGLLPVAAQGSDPSAHQVLLPGNRWPRAGRWW